MLDTLKVLGKDIPVSYNHTLVLGSGAASLAAAIRLKRAGIDDLCIVTDNINGGTSRNTGSDKQTYYKLSDSDTTADSPYEMAESIYKGGAVHGDIALVESLVSENAFYHLVGLGVPFPFNKWGGYTGYKTDHDPKMRGTSLGPYTSKIMVEYLEKEIHQLGIQIKDHHDCVKLLHSGDRITGALCLDKRNLQSDEYGLCIHLCDNMVFGLGGPGGLYSTSVYPPAHSGGIGLALEAGVEAVNLTESQFGIGSVKFRWNLSGSYQQVIPSYYSIDKKTGETFHFLNDFFDSMSELSNAIFLKGYQWPFDPKKIEGKGSSLIDLLVFREIEVHDREVYMDFRSNPSGDDRIGSFSRECLSPEAEEYWSQSSVDGSKPIDRLKQMNPNAVQLYESHNIDLENEALQIAVCAQHNNGGLAGDIWWESTNRPHFFPIGEVNGSHGVYRPGGSALNSGQVAAFRVAQKIAGVYRKASLNTESALNSAVKPLESFLQLIDTILSGKAEKKCETAFQQEFQHRMSHFAALIRSSKEIHSSCKEASRQHDRFKDLRIDLLKLPFVLKQRHLAIAQMSYLEAIRNYMDMNGGSRGSFLVLEEGGKNLHTKLELDWDMKEENPDLIRKIQKICMVGENLEVSINWEPCREIPRDSHWFENMWSKFLEGTVFD